MNLPAPVPFVSKGDIVENWVLWKQTWKNYELATDLDKKEDKKRAAVFKTVIGAEGVRLLRQIGADEITSLDDIIKRLDAEIIPQKNIIYERYVFFSTVQDEQMDYTNFIRILKERSISCEFKDLKDEMIRDRFVVGMKDNDFRKRLLRQRDLTLQKVIDEAMTVQETEKQLQKMKPDSKSDFKFEDEIVNKFEKFKSTKMTKTRSGGNMGICRYCGGKHPFEKEKCPAYGKKCLKCSNFKNMCKMYVKQLEKEPDSSSETDSVLSIASSRKAQKLLADVKVNGMILKAQIDTGATCNVIGWKDISKWDCESKVSNSSQVLTCYNGEKEMVEGECILEMEVNSKIYKVKFYVTRQKGIMLGLNASLKMGLINPAKEVMINKIDIEDFPQIFEESEIGDIEGVIAIADDIMVFGEGDTMEEALRDHDIKLEKVLQRAEQRNLKLNKKKCKIRKTEIEYMGHLFTNKGIKPDHRKVKAVEDMGRPESESQIRSFLGLVNYMAKFVPDLSTIAAPLRESFSTWGVRQETAWKTIKRVNVNIADAMSRLPATDMAEKDIIVAKIIEESDGLTETGISATTLHEIREHLNEEEVAVRLKWFIENGWPDQEKMLPALMKDWWKVREQLTVCDGIILKNQQVYIPEKMRGDILEKIHKGHQGLEACLRYARSRVFWIHMARDIKDTVHKCEICEELDVKRNQKETLQLRKVPEGPWMEVATDILEYDKHKYLVVVDYFSSFFEFKRLQNVSSHSTISALKHIFARYGVPQVIYSDEGTNYSSKEFKLFAREWNFTLKTSSPHHHQSNGKAESAVKQVKRLLKLKEKGEDVEAALMVWRNTPTAGLVVITTSPAQRLFGRSLRTTLCSTKEGLKQEVNYDTIHEQLNKKMQRYKKTHDSSAKDLPSLRVGESVRVLLNPSGINDQIWKRGVVLKRLDSRSYLLEVDGRRYRRNRIHLKQRKTEIGSAKDEEAYEDWTLDENKPEQTEKRCIVEEVEQEEVEPEEKKKIQLEKRQQENTTEQSQQTSLERGMAYEEGHVSRFGRRINKPKKLDL
ncbi:unnamed protein product [Arctia plantaginis]|uniref:RNA-directed DNA polymerase n=1 Tax=Arctia plantaginis TaxID=874455 RepID=A0A8S0Z4J7_ARCPL|nr:unnamed protein product [Arctia plantaginis]